MSALGHHHNQQMHPTYAFNRPPARPSIDVDALAAGVQRYIPNPNIPLQGGPRGPVHHPAYAHPNAYIALPPGVDPATVDFRTFYPYNPSEVKHRKRTTRPQQKILEETFKRETKPNAQLRKQLAAQLEMTPRGVQVWFQNRRAKEKNLARKAAAAGKSLSSLDRQPEDSVDADVDGDADHDEDLPSSNANIDYQTGSSTLYGDGLAETEPEHSRSSKSPESTSPEATPPNIHTDVPPHVSVSPPDDDELVANSEQKHDVLCDMRSPPMSMSGMLPSMVNNNGQSAGVSSMNSSLSPSATDAYSFRRPSLPTHLISDSSRQGQIGAMRTSGAMSYSNSMGSSRPMAFDPNARRMSLDRLASHPYAHIAAQANSMLYGHSMASRYRPSLPNTTHSTPTLTPQANTTELPQVSEENTNIVPAPLPSASQPVLAHHGSLSPPTMDMRSELMHRQSLPAQFIQTSGIPSAPSGPLTSSHLHTRFPRAGQMFSIPTRTYQPPIPGPLPNPDFSFGSPSNPSTVREEAENVSDGIASGSGTPAGQTQNYQFPLQQKDDGENTGVGIVVDSGDGDNVAHGGGFMGMGNRSSALYRMQQGGLDPYAHRFGSIASIAESESSVNSGIFSEAGSFDPPQQDSFNSGQPPSFNDARRPSCTGQMMNLFANMEVRNDSTSSLSHELSDSRNLSLQGEMPISRSSELALALMPDENKKSPLGSCLPYPQDSGHRDSDVSSFDQSHRSSMSSSGPSDFMLSVAPSVNSSRSSLGVHCAPIAPRITTDKLDLDFLHNFDDTAVSETGHYSPVANHGQSVHAFEFPPPSSTTTHGIPTSQSTASLEFASSAGHAGSRSDFDLPLLYPVDDQAQQQQQHQRHASQPQPQQGHSSSSVANSLTGSGTYPSASSQQYGYY